jgi:hypothetical protein
MSATEEKTKKLRADFLRIDSAMALTFANIALTTRDKVRRERATKAARRAYNTIVRLMDGVWLKPSDAQTLKENLTRLQGELETLGETF